MKTLYKIEAFACNDGTWHVAKLIEGKCVFLYSVSDKEKNEEMFKKICDGYDPAKDKRRRISANTHELYVALIAKTNGESPTARLVARGEHGTLR